VRAEQLKYRLRRPAWRWLVITAWTLTGLALAANLANVAGIYRTAARIHNWVGVLWLFGAPCALTLAMACLLVPRLRRRPTTRRGAILCVLLAVASLLGFPFSYGATKLLSYDTWFGQEGKKP
jgi:hypothetical protein